MIVERYKRQPTDGFTLCNPRTPALSGAGQVAVTAVLTRFLDLWLTTIAI